MPSYRLLPVVGLAALLGVACTEGPPTSVPDGDAPRFSHKPGHDPDGGGMPEGDPSITLEFVDDAANNIQSDARGQDVDGECGVQATFNLTDARLDPAAKKIHPRDAGVCGGRDARKVRVAFTDRMDGSPPNGQDGNTVDAGFFKVNEVEQVTEADGTVARTVVVHGPGCALGVRFNPNLDAESDAVEVTKNADGTWTVRTKPFPDNVAVCLPDEGAPNPPPRSYYHMPFEVTVQLQ